MGSQSEKSILHAFASCIFKDVQRYVLEHQDEYQEWLRNQDANQNEEMETEKV